MQKAILLFNPHAGRHRQRRVHDVQTALTVLEDAGVEASAASTSSPTGTAEQVRQAIAGGCDAVLACGGDGTVHDVLQGLVGSQAALGVIPLGTANSLAHDLGLPSSPAAAAGAALTAERRRVAVGRISYQDFEGKTASRFFIVTAGVGVDAQVFYELQAGAKSRFGMAAYYAMATRLWLTHQMPEFAVEPSGKVTDPVVLTDVSQLLAVRIRNFGGLLRELAPGAGLDRNELCLVLFRGRSRLAMLRYVLRGIIGAKWRPCGVEVRQATSVSCSGLSGHGLDASLRSAGQPRRLSLRKGGILVEADGELLGTLPAQISIVPDALTLLAPRGLAA
jgi:diacylglycerol kinase family enzyme